MIEDCIKACVGKRCIVQFTAHARYLVTHAQNGRIGMVVEGDNQPAAFPILLGEVVEYKGAYFLRLDDEAGKSGNKILAGLNPATVSSISLVSDRPEDQPSIVHLS